MISGHFDLSDSLAVNACPTQQVHGCLRFLSAAVMASLNRCNRNHEAELSQAVRDGELWRLWYTTIPEPQHMQAEIERRLGLQAAGSMLPFVIRDTAGRVVGMTTFMNIDAAAQRLEIGSTWIAASAQRGPINTEAKLMLLMHAFETLGCIAVEFRTHFLNQQSRRAIERLGARLDGVFAQSPTQPGRLASRHLCLQHRCRRMACREDPSSLAA